MVSGVPSVLVIGAGAIGAFYGAMLASRGARVSVVCRSDFDVVSRDGYTITSPMGDRIFRPVEVLHDASECAPPPDYLLLSVKVLDGVDRAALIRAAMGPETAIVLIENGIDIEAEISQAFPGNELISVLAYVGLARPAPGHIRHFANGYLVAGNYPSGVSPRTRELAALFEAAGITCTVAENVVTARWHKSVWNAVFNPVSVLGGAMDVQTMLTPPDGEAFVRQAMLEVCAVAAAYGHPLLPAVVDQFVEGTRKMGAYKTSMAQDYESGRPLEVEAILGNVVRAARRQTVATPALDSLYALMKMVQARQANEK